MIFEFLTRPEPAKAAGRRLYAALVAQARAPRLYGELGAPDTPDGRFEVYTLHVLLALARLKGGGRRAAAVSQAVFDAYLGGLDHGLRELAVGDLSVGKTMRKLAGAFYGRARALEIALDCLPDRSQLEALIGRTLLSAAAAPGPATPGPAAALAAHFLRLREELAAADIERMLEGELCWPAPA